MTSYLIINTYRTNLRDQLVLGDVQVALRVPDVPLDDAVRKAAVAQRASLAVLLAATQVEERCLVRERAPTNHRYSAVRAVVHQHLVLLVTDTLRQLTEYTLYIQYKSI